MHEAIQEPENAATLHDCDRAFDCLAALCHHAYDLGMDKLAAALEDALDACLVERAHRVPKKVVFISRRAKTRLYLRPEQRLI